MMEVRSGEWQHEKERGRGAARNLTSVAAAGARRLAAGIRLPVRQSRRIDGVDEAVVYREQRRVAAEPPRRLRSGGRSLQRELHSLGRACKYDGTRTLAASCDRAVHATAPEESTLVVASSCFVVLILDPVILPLVAVGRRLGAKHDLDRKLGGTCSQGLPAARRDAHRAVHRSVGADEASAAILQRRSSQPLQELEVA